MKSNFNGLLKLLTVAALAKKSTPFDSVQHSLIDWAGEAVAFLEEAVKQKYVKFGTKQANSFARIVEVLHAHSHNKKPALIYKRIQADIETFAAWMEDNRKKGSWARFVELTVDQTTFLDNLRKIFLIDSESADRWLSSKVGLLKEPQLTKCFAANIDEEFERPEDFPRDFNKKSDEQILNIVTNLALQLGATKELAPLLQSQKDAKALDEKKFELWKAGSTYLQKKAKDAITKIVRNYGHVDRATVPVVSVKDMRKYLSDMGIIWPTINAQLKRGELVDDNLHIYTKDGQSLGRSIHPTAKVTYNANYLPVYADKFSTGRGGMYYLKLDFAWGGSSTIAPVGRANANKEKTFGKVAEFTKKLDTYRKRWTDKLASKDDEERMAATILEIVYQTSIRIGSRIGTATVEGKVTETYGLTVLKTKNAKKLDNRVKLTYVGKAGQNQTQYLSPGTDKHYKQAVANFLTYLEGKVPNDFIFTVGNARFTSGLATEYLKEFTGSSLISVHKFRHIKANSLAEPILADCPYLGKKDNSRTEVMKWFKEQMKQVGEQLGHFTKGDVTGTTAIYSYIDPRISKKFFEDCHVQIPKEIVKLLAEEK